MPDFLTGYSLAQIIGGVVFAVCLIYCVVKGVAYTPARCRCGATAVRGNAAGLCHECITTELAAAIACMAAEARCRLCNAYPVNATGWLCDACAEAASPTTKETHS